MLSLKKYISILLLVLFSVLSFAFVKGQIPDEINSAIRAGNSSLLAKHFNSSLELKIVETGDVFAKAQAEIMLKNFFAKNKPANYQILQEGKTEESRFTIGKLTTIQNKSYMIYFVTINTKGKPLITQFKIENE